MDIQTIPAWLWVLNPCYIDFGQQAQGDLQYAKIQLWNGSTMLSEGFYIAKDDVLKCDISGYAKAAFNLVPEDIKRNPANFCPAETYLILTVKIYINADNELIYDQDHTFVYGGKKPADDFELMEDYAPFGGTTYAVPWHFLTEFERPKYFIDQPFELRACKIGDTDANQWGVSVTEYYEDNSTGTTLSYALGSYNSDPAIVKIKPIEESGLTVSLRTRYLMIGDGQNWLESRRVDVVRDMIPEGIFLRWVNRLGGIDQWYFTKKDTKFPVKTQSVPLPESLDFTYNWNQGIGKVVDKEQSTVYVLGSTLVAVADYEVISHISKSPRVDMYLGSGKWIQVMVLDSDWTISHENDYQDLEFSIATI